MDVRPQLFGDVQLLNDRVEALAFGILTVGLAVHDKEMNVLRPPQGMEVGNLPTHPFRLSRIG